MLDIPTRTSLLSGRIDRMPDVNESQEGQDRKFKKWKMEWAREPELPKKPLRLGPLLRMEVQRAKIGQGEEAAEELRQRLLKEGPRLRRKKRRLKYDPSKERQN